MKHKLEARAKCTFKVKTPHGTHVDLKVPKGNCLIKALEHVALYSGYKLEVNLEPVKAEK